MITPNEKMLAAIQDKMNDVRYLWDDNFCPDLEKFLDKLSAKQPVIDNEDNYSFGSSFGSVFHKPKIASGYGLNQQQNTVDEQTLRDDFAATPRLGG